jgi:hypothetical protein
VRLQRKRKICEEITNTTPIKRQSRECTGTRPPDGDPSCRDCTDLSSDYTDRGSPRLERQTAVPCQTRLRPIGPIRHGGICRVSSGSELSERVGTGRKRLRRALRIHAGMVGDPRRYGFWAGYGAAPGPPLLSIGRLRILAPGGTCGPGNIRHANRRRRRDTGHLALRQRLRSSFRFQHMVSSPAR